MKRLVTAFALAAASCAPVEAATVWYGTFVLESVTAPCTAIGLSAGNAWHLTYRPAGFNNGPDSQIALISNQSSLHFELAGGPFVSGATLDGALLGSRGGINSSFSALLQSFASGPPAPTVATRQIHLVGQIANFFNDPNCTITFRSYVVQRPDTDPTD